MLFVLHRVDDPDRTHMRKVVRDDHLKHLEAYRAKILLAGPYLDPDTGSDRGSMFLLDCVDLEEARRFAHDDPYAKAGVFADIQVWAWAKRTGSVAL